MIQDIDNTTGFNDDTNTNLPNDTSNTGSEKKMTNDLGNTSFTQEEIEEANKPQPNVILNQVSENTGAEIAYRDRNRVSARANEASDPNDTNTGSMISGGVKGASQS